MKIELEAPATSANLGAGYDVFGLALNKPTDYMRVEESDETEIVVKGEFGDRVPSEASENSAGVVAKEMSKEVRVGIEKNIPPGGGLGSSAASAAGAAVGINELFGLGFGMDELLEFAALGERVAAGEKHYDNVAPALFGDFCIVDNGLVNIEMPDFSFVIVCPEANNTTREARELVPKEVPIGDLKRNIGFASRLLIGVYEGDLELFGEGLNDVVVVPERAKEITGFDEAREAAYKAGAYGCTLSGSGPSMIAVGEDEEKIARAMQEALREEGVGSRTYFASPGDGVKLL